MLRNWRTWTLLGLLIGPLLVYAGLGAIWLGQHRGPLGFRGELLTYATLAWVMAGVAASLLASRWTRRRESVLPPIDWEAPATFTPRDRRAWEIVQEHAGAHDEGSGEALTRLDTYLDTGRRLAWSLAQHYRPDAGDPIEHLPVLEIVTAIELAIEDLNRLSREIPGADLVTAGHWKQATRAAGYVQRASDLYTLLLPVFQPLTGLARLGTQSLVTRPAWRQMQQNLIQWFYQAYVNRLGMHLIELYSGRLAIGPDRYRAWRRTLQREGAGAVEAEPIRVVVLGPPESGKSTLVGALRAALEEPIAGSGGGRSVTEGALRDALRRARIEEPDSREGRRRSRGPLGIGADLLLLVVDARGEPGVARQILDAWKEGASAQAEEGDPLAPVVLVLTHIDLLAPGVPWIPPYDWEHGKHLVEEMVRVLVGRMKGEFPEVDAVVVTGGVGAAAQGTRESLIPALGTLLPRAQRSALLRGWREHGERSRAGRLLGQVARKAADLWGGR
jgi:hypothetical protein